MSKHDAPGVLSKEALKALRAERGEAVARASANAREHKKALAAIRKRLTESPATIPEIAEAAGLSPDKALWLLATMRKFGQAVEAEKDGDYYRYAPAGEAPSAEAD